MKKKVINDNLSLLASTVVGAMQDKKARDIVSVDLRNINSRITDKFIVCHGDSDRQVDAIAQWVEEKVFKELKEKPWHREGFENKEWILLDYVNLVVHIFVEDKRKFYAIEELWGDAEFEKFENFS